MKKIFLLASVLSVAHISACKQRSFSNKLDSEKNKPAPNETTGQKFTIEINSNGYGNSFGIKHDIIAGKIPPPDALVFCLINFDGLNPGAKFDCATDKQSYHALWPKQEGHVLKCNFKANASGYCVPGFPYNKQGEDGVGVLGLTFWGLEKEFQDPIIKLDVMRKTTVLFCPFELGTLKENQHAECAGNRATYFSRWPNQQGFLYRCSTPYVQEVPQYQKFERLHSCFLLELLDAGF